MWSNFKINEVWKEKIKEKMDKEKNKEGVCVREEVTI